MSFLKYIDSPENIKKLNIQELESLCDEIRLFLIESISRTGGHLASNLGVIELTVALHKVFDTSVDRVIFDVGHQCYAHKILTGRRDQFDSLRSINGISGFPKPCESNHDAFATGHASTSISAALGMARARTLSNEDYNVVAVIGDGALTGGLAYEALNDAGQANEKLIVLLNDNGMSIQRNVGGVARQLGRLRLKPQYSKIKTGVRAITGKIPAGKYLYRIVHNTKMFFKHMIVRGSMFEDLGFAYLGPVDGHNLEELCSLLEIAKGYPTCPNPFNYRERQRISLFGGEPVKISRYFSVRYRFRPANQELHILLFKCLRQQIGGASKFGQAHLRHNSGNVKWHRTRSILMRKTQTARLMLGLLRSMQLLWPQAWQKMGCDRFVQYTPLSFSALTI